MSVPALRLTEEDYLASEELSPVRREYVDGFVYAQAGGSLPHNRIASNISGVLLPAARQHGCWTYAADMKVRVDRLGQLRYYYPDLVVCEAHDNLRQAESQPCLIVEILSRSTRQVDMTFKAQDYLSLPSLQGYLLVDSEARAAELYRRLPGGGWTTETVQDALTLPCVNVLLSLGEIYAGVRITTPPE